MSADRKTKAGKEGDGFSSEKTVEDRETFDEALSKAGFVPAKVGRKMVSQGKQRETLKKKSSKHPDN